MTSWLAPPWPRPVPPTTSEGERLADLIEHVDRWACGIGTRDEVLAALKRARG